MKEFGGKSEVNEVSASQQMERPQMSPEVREKYERITGLDKIPKNENKDKEMSAPEGERPIDVAKKDELPKPDSELQRKYEELSGLSDLKAYLDKSSEGVGEGEGSEAGKETSGEKDNAENRRELTEEEKQWLKDTLGWSDKQIDKCTIDKDGVIHYRTDRSDLEGKTSENGVPYERKQIVINGVRIEGVFPKFDSVYTTELSPEKQKSNAYAKECNANLKEAVDNDPELRKKFTKEQLDDIENGRTPTGYVWHHNEEQGKMELVKKEDHDRTSGGAAHTGGSVLWGPDSSAPKGEKF